MTDEATPQPEPFSPQNAIEAVEDLFEALTKSKRMEYLGHLNEVLVVLRELAKGRDPLKTVLT